VGGLAEGQFSAVALTELARERDVDMPIANCVQALIEGSLDVKAAVSALLARPPKGEE
jgi:glycerol-3-phosphate dehydrogenase (NAD(P)+)